MLTQGRYLDLLLRGWALMFVPVCICEYQNMCHSIYIGSCLCRCLSVDKPGPPWINIHQRKIRLAYKKLHHDCPSIPTLSPPLVTLSMSTPLMISHFTPKSLWVTEHKGQRKCQRSFWMFYGAVSSVCLCCAVTVCQTDTVLKMSKHRLQVHLWTNSLGRRS